VKELGLDPGLLISQIVNFGLLAVLLYVLLHKPILSMLQERAKRIKKGVEDAERAGKLAADAETRHAEELERARTEAREVIERATLNAQQERQEILAQARQEAHELILRAQQQAQRQSQEEELTRRQQMIDLAIAAASRLLEENLDEQKQHQLIQEFLAEVGGIK
jgi:F-type H+-transporting ATPase subunit b